MQVVNDLKEESDDSALFRTSTKGFFVNKLKYFLKIFLL